VYSLWNVSMITFNFFLNMNTHLLQEHWLRDSSLSCFCTITEFQFIICVYFLLYLLFCYACTLCLCSMFMCWLMYFYGKSWTQSHVLWLSFPELFWPSKVLYISLSIFNPVANFYTKKEASRILSGIALRLYVILEEQNEYSKPKHKIISPLI
jgi:hypothetical protein